MNPPYEKTTDGHDEDPRRPPTPETGDLVQRQEDGRPPNVDDLVIRQIEAWQMDTEVQAFMHSKNRKRGRQGN
jgi:hypothetical protein